MRVACEVVQRKSPLPLKGNLFLLGNPAEQLD
jgi:hypothetical protein